jgi:hypothetical protein
MVVWADLILSSSRPYASLRHSLGIFLGFLCQVTEILLPENDIRKLLEVVNKKF